MLNENAVVIFWWFLSWSLEAGLMPNSYIAGPPQGGGGTETVAAASTFWWSYLLSRSVNQKIKDYYAIEDVSKMKFSNAV